MKCPSCQFDQKARLGLTCANCGYKFVFNPKELKLKRLTDGKFFYAIRVASQEGTKYFTANQLYAAYANRIKSSFGCAIASNSR